VSYEKLVEVVCGA